MPSGDQHPAALRMQQRFEYAQGFAAFYMPKGGIVAAILHQVKYKYKRKLAEYLGTMLAEQLQKYWVGEPFDLVVAIPIHKKKLEKRGYNQSHFLASQIALLFNVPFDAAVLVKTSNTTSQTSKSRLERIDNIKTTFGIVDADRLRHKHILLVDDVLTTGSTLEACALLLLAIPGVTVSFATLSLATE